MKELESFISVLGADNTEDLRKGIVNILLNRLQEDLQDYSDYIIYPPDIRQILDCVIEDTNKKIRKMYKDAVIEINQSYIDKMKTYMEGQFDEDKKLRHDVINLATDYYWRGNQDSKEREFAIELMKILKVTEPDIEKRRYKKEDAQDGD